MWRGMGKGETTSIQLRDNKLQIVNDTPPNYHLPPAPLLPRSIPARRVAVLGDVSSTGEIVHCESLTSTIELYGAIYHYCEVSDGIGYYRTAEEIGEIDELVASEG